jgi:hypothetical protein
VAFWHLSVGFGICYTNFIICVSSPATHLYHPTISHKFLFSLKLLLSFYFILDITLFSLFVWNESLFLICYCYYSLNPFSFLSSFNIWDNLMQSARHFYFHFSFLWISTNIFLHAKHQSRWRRVVRSGFRG